jgi:hypothetical protein
MNCQIDFAGEKCSLNFFGEKTLAANLPERSGFHIALGGDVDHFDGHAAQGQLRSDPFRLPAREGARARSQS